MKKRNFKLLGLTALMSVGLMSGSINVHAAYDIEEGRTGSITLYKLVSEDGKYQSGNFYEQDTSNIATVGVEGVGFKYLKIGELVQVPASDANSTGLYYTLDSGFLSMLESLEIVVEPTVLDGSTYYTSDAVNDALKTLTDLKDATYGNSVDGTQTGTELMLDYIDENGTAMPDTNAEGKTTVSGLEQALYIVGEYKRPAATDDGMTPALSRASAPFLMPIPMTNITTIDGAAPGTAWQYDLVAYPKSEQISIRKDIITSGNDVVDVEEGDNMLEQTIDKQIGDNVEFLLSLDVPALQPKSDGTPNTMRKYIISDTLSDGLTLDSLAEDNFTVKLGVGEYTDPSLQTIPATDPETQLPNYTITAGDGKGGNGFTLTFTEQGLKLFDQLSADSKLYVTYEARLNENAAEPADAIKEESNEFKLTYGTSVTEDFEIESNKDIKVYTYEVNIQKTFTNEEVDDASAVAFTVDRMLDGEGMDGADGDVANRVSFIKEADGEYHVYDNKEVGEPTTEIHVAADGHLSIKGLDDGKYEIHEIATMPGYNLLREAIQLTINEPDPEDGTIASSTIFNGTSEINVGQGLERGCIDFEIVNNESINALHTGGDGVNTTILALGGLTMIAAGVGLVIGKKKEAEE